MRIAALIPARAGSKRIKGKNVKPLGDKPLIVWTIALARELVDVEEVFVSSDSQHYCDLASNHGGHPIHRPKALASDSAEDREVIAHAMRWMKCDLCVYLRPTTPFRTISMVEAAIKQFLWAESAFDPPTSLRSMEATSESVAKWFRVRPGNVAIPLSKKYVDKPSQLCPATYKPNGYVDILRAEHGGSWGRNIMAFLTPPTIELDTEEDWEFAEWKAKRMSLGEVVL